MSVTSFFPQLLGELGRSVSEAQLRRVLFLYGFSVVGILLLPTVSLLVLTLDMHEFRWLAGVNIIVAASFAGNLIFLHRHRNIGLAENILLLLLFVILSAGLFGTHDESGPYWLGVFPPIALFLKGVRVGLLACGVLIASLLVITALQYVGLVQTVASITALLMLVASLTTLSAIMAISRAILADTEQRLQKRSRELSREVLERTSVEGLLRKNEGRIRFMAHRDPLTGLPNRALCYDRLELALAYARRYSNQVAVMLFDINDFTGINERYGNDTADQALRALGQRLRTLVDPCDTVGRSGVDEFVVILSEAGPAADVQRRLKGLSAAIAQPISVRGVTLRVSTAAGTAHYPTDADQSAALMDVADARLFANREANRIVATEQEKGDA